jgi:hypothetical protein
LAAAVVLAATWGHSMAATPERGAQPVYKQIKDWIVACDNTRACVAKFVPDEMGKRPSEGEPGYLEISREPGPHGRLVLVFQGDQATPDPSTFRLDGKPIASLSWRRDDGETTASLKDADAARFVAAVRDGALIAYSPAKDAPWVSLSGMTAALLAMDDAQGRVGGETALIRRGPAPTASVPPAPPLPVVRAAPAREPLENAPAFAAAVRRSQAALLDKHDCEKVARDDQAFGLNPAEAIVIIGCRQAAYQSSMLLFRAPRGAPAKARLVVFPPQPGLDAKAVAAQDGEYVEGEWDPKTATFSEHAKGRGIADCGESSAWVFDGRDFHLASFNYQELCGGPPGDWPTLFRAKVVQ